MPTNTTPSIPEIPIQNTDAPVELPVKFDADVHAFLSEHQKGRGDLNHTVNSIVRVYRDCLPVNKRGGLEAKDGKQPQQNGAGGKVSELKKQAAG